MGRVPVGAAGVSYHLCEQADDALGGARHGGGVGGAPEDEGARSLEVCDVVEAPLGRDRVLAAMTARIVDLVNVSVRATARIRTRARARVRV